MINILSVDWDYFSDCTDEERLTLFPDGGNEEIGLGVSLQIWNFCYVNSIFRKKLNPNAKELLDIKVREEEFSFLLECIQNNRRDDCIINLADSHADIYDFLMEFPRCQEDKVLNIYNIDHHSDCYNIGNELNCGNWVNKLDEHGFINKYTWIYDDKKESIKNLSCEYKISKKLKLIKGIKWDYIFICRSSIWSPPHLDIHFNKLYTFFMFECGLRFNEKFFIDRYEFIKYNIETNVKQREEMFELHKEVIENNKKCDCTEELQTLKKFFKNFNKKH